MSALSFHSPYLLAGAALLVGLWAAWYLPKLFGSRGDGRSAFRFPSVSPFKEIGGGQAVLPFKLLKAARLAVLILLAIALGRPQSGKEHTKISTEGIDIILAVDTSGSMEALDLDTDQPLAQRRNRLEIVKDVVQDFVEARPNDQMGLVVFGSEAYTQCPMTLDHGILSGFLDRLEIGMAGDGTALGNAIGRAVKRLKDSDAKSKVVVLLTDGRSNAGKLSPLKAAEVAQSLGIKIYTSALAHVDRPPSSVRASSECSRYTRTSISTKRHSPRSPSSRKVPISVPRTSKAYATSIRRSMPWSELRSSPLATSNTMSISIGS